jgi:hypothetical protein
MNNEEIKKELTGIIFDYLRYRDARTGKQENELQKVNKFIETYQQTFWLQRTRPAEEKQLKDSPDMQLFKEIRYMLELREYIIKNCKRCDLIESVLYDLTYAITERVRKIT